MDDLTEYPAIARARHLLQDKLLQDLMAREADSSAAATRTGITASWKEDLESAYQAAAASLTQLADRFDADLEPYPARAASIVGEAVHQRQELFRQMGWRLPECEQSTPSVPEEVAEVAEPPAPPDKPTSPDEQRVIVRTEEGRSDAVPTAEAPSGEGTDVEQDLSSDTGDPRRQGDSSTEASGDETAASLEPETVGIRSIRGISIRVRKRGLGSPPGTAVTLQSWHRAHMVRQDGGEDGGEVAREMWAMGHSATRLQRRVLRALLGLVRQRKELRRLVRRRCLVRAQAAGTQHSWYRDFDGFEAERTRSSEGRTAMAEEYCQWRAKGRALARWMRHAAVDGPARVRRDRFADTAAMERRARPAMKCW